MTPEEFVSAIRLVVAASAKRITIQNIEKPPGREPSANALALREWYRALHVPQQENVKSVIHEAVEEAVFEFFCVLDGVQVIENIGPKSDFRLMQHAPYGTVTCLNPPNGEMLHDLFNAR